MVSSRSTRRQGLRRWWSFRNIGIVTILVIVVLLIREQLQQVEAVPKSNILRLSSQNKIQDDLELVLYEMKETQNRLQALEKKINNPTLASSDVKESWRVNQDCSTYDVNCPTRARYKKYELAEIGENMIKQQIVDISSRTKMENNVQKKKSYTYSLQFWHLVTQSDKAAIAYAEKEISKDAAQRARDGLIAYASKESIDQALTRAFERTDSRRLTAWTMTNAAYAQDMLADVVNMAYEIAKFEQFVIICLDIETLRACYALGFDCGAINNEDNTGLRSAVQNTKFIVSHWLTMRNTPFAFFEMDVWFLQSASTLPMVAKLQNMGQNYNESIDMLFAAHQNNPTATNIGFYLVAASKRTQEFFSHCIEESQKHRPRAHDQNIVHNMLSYHRAYRRKSRIPSEKQWKDKPRTPKPENPIEFAFIPPHIGVSSTHPIPTERTVFVHTLGTVPLQAQHGKRIHAKELGIWHGAFLGYYARPWLFRQRYTPTPAFFKHKFLALDGHPLGNAISISEIFGYHNPRHLKARLAFLITIAKATGRILILPKIIADYHLYFTWPFLDLSSLQGLCDFRETNFFSNPKSWLNYTHPFLSIAQVSYTNKAIGIRFPYTQNSPTWYTSPNYMEQSNHWTLFAHLMDSLLSDTQLILLHDGIVSNDFVRIVTNCKSLDQCEKQHSYLTRLTRFIHLHLKFCGETINLDRPAAKTFQGFDCFGSGSPDHADPNSILNEGEG
mmetsp:Transcript_8447/g.12901  ORF Transcript_8447/g.12901 Transcript_8447/m.12901 type:complete len:728 (+) Transcript_8447:76-2259(+)